MGWKKKTALSVLVTVGALLAYKYAIWSTGPLCNEVAYEQVMNYIKNDLKRPSISRSILFRLSTLGTSTPVIQFSQNPDLVESETYLVSFQVSGPLKIHHLFAIYECRTGTIEYSVK
ncbi:hypothetical protein Dd1591_3597 [Dickeya chrysanthemi Ech1591]|uniref:Uncharacterized protein n=1 Tax=Dickeya chrysanthemi (strain Ech1591) TaxID=561229 RepID=C6CKP2_DICC1|nr:YebF family protein [Dickeya chrysanthemi]ACT08406.1 hypothetical protein Dd1591_3597 [Dickeya chrysanthemi Ech1591]WJM85125.1 YebF family protein [Dickeya chrysanthemi]